MLGTLNKGSLVKSAGGGNGGGGSSTFPMIVTDSGSSLPVDLTGYNEGDTFLDTTEKKIYQAVITGYVIGESTTISCNIDYATGIASGFASDKYAYKTSFSGWEGNRNYTFKFKISSVQVTPIVRIYYANMANANSSLFAISNDNKIHHIIYSSSGNTHTKTIDEKILDTEIIADKIYILNINKTGTSCVAQLTDENGTVLEEKNFTTTDINYANNIIYGNGYVVNSYVYPSHLSAYLGQSSGNLVVPNTTTMSWDSGTDLTDKTEYADKTNGALYLYDNDELVKIGGNLKKKVYTISADNTSTLDVSADFTKIVDVLKNGVEIEITDDYTISSGVITFVTALSTTDKITVKGD